MFNKKSHLLLLLTLLLQMPVMALGSARSLLVFSLDVAIQITNTSNFFSFAVDKEGQSSGIDYFLPCDPTTPPNHTIALCDITKYRTSPYPREHCFHLLHRACGGQVGVMRFTRQTRLRSRSDGSIVFCSGQETCLRSVNIHLNNDLLLNPQRHILGTEPHQLRHESLERGGTRYVSE